MILKRLLAAAAAIGAALSAGCAFMVALCYGLFALIRTYLGPAGAAGCVALAIALLALIVVLVFSARAAGGKKAAAKRAEASGGPLDRFLLIARDRPIAASAGALGAGLLALRNPALVGMVLKMFTEPKRDAKRRK